MNLWQKAAATSLALAAVAAPSATASAPPVGKLPAHSTVSLGVRVGDLVVVRLPRPSVAGRSWRIARRYDPKIIREIAETDTATGVTIRFRAVGVGRAQLVFAVTKGESSYAYRAKAYQVTVSR